LQTIERGLIDFIERVQPADGIRQFIDDLQLPLVPISEYQVACLHELFAPHCLEQSRDVFDAIILSQLEEGVYCIKVRDVYNHHNSPLAILTRSA
jgi:hypothetical protein